MPLPPIGLLFWIVFVIVGLAVGKLRGGSFRAIGDLKIRGLIPLALIAAFESFAIQRTANTFPVLIPFIPWMNTLAYVPLLIIVVINRDVFRPIAMWTTGLLMNATVIALNGGRMPSLRRNLVGEQSRGHTFLNDQTILPWLGDWLPLPEENYFSPGDVFIGVALVLTIQWAMLAKPVDQPAELAAQP